MCACLAQQLFFNTFTIGKLHSFDSEAFICTKPLRERHTFENSLQVALIVEDEIST